MTESLFFLILTKKITLSNLIIKYVPTTWRKHYKVIAHGQKHVQKKKHNA